MRLGIARNSHNRLSRNTRCQRLDAPVLKTKWGLLGALLMGPDGGFITSSDILMDGGVAAAYWYGELAP